ncbi:hypothetical protein DERF_013996 [Dermatophagoides farinae]|uniref:Uncharacterized protein n=1 Tax=Dermatophagoides farinae TaxID=6954 RepID=A0A922KXE3_DERFA|nr:hypothetical protein DERF_013996 [Dermatophagoides farinae]
MDTANTMLMRSNASTTVSAIGHKCRLIDFDEPVGSSDRRHKTIDCAAAIRHEDGHNELV